MLKASIERALMVACAFAALATCKKNEPLKPALPPTPAAPAAPRRAAPATPPPAAAPPGASEMKDLLSEDKLARFATYRKEMLPVAGGAVGAGSRQAALEKSGLSQDEVYKLNRVVTPYYARTYAVRDAVQRAAEVRAKIERAKAEGDTPSPIDIAMDRLYGGQLARLEVLRKDFATDYGEDALTVVQKHESDFHAIHERILGAATAGPAHRPYREEITAVQ